MRNISNQLTNHYFRQSRFCFCNGSKPPQQVIISTYSKTGFYKIPCLLRHLNAFKIPPYLWKFDVSLLRMILQAFHSRTHSPLAHHCRPRGCSVSFRGSREFSNGRNSKRSKACQNNILVLVKHDALSPYSVIHAFWAKQKNNDDRTYQGARVSRSCFVDRTDCKLTVSSPTSSKVSERKDVRFSLNVSETWLQG